MKKLWTLRLIAILALTLAACARPAPATTTQPPATTPTPVPPPATTPTTTPTPAVLNFTLAEYSNSPQEVTVAAGQPVTINVTNGGRFQHNVYFHNMSSVNEKMGPNLAAGQSRSATVTFDQAGLFPFYCPVLQHENRGMVGALTVTGPKAATPSLKLRHPAPAANLTDVGQVVVAVEITGFDINSAAIGGANRAGEGHWHLLLDGKLVAPQGKIYATLKDVAQGTHTVKAELHNNDHSLLSPAVEDSVSFSVVPPPPPTTTPGGTTPR